MQSGETHLFFGRNSSALLDVIRFTAALAVAIVHLQGAFVTVHLEPDWSGNAAVCIFFVLSGFVIRYVTRSRLTDPTSYWIDRSSRMESVVLPALLITVLAEALAKLLHPAIYHQLAATSLWRDLPFQLISNATFTAGFWGYGAVPLSNGSFWSLPFEVVFYILYGLLHYRTRWSWSLAIALLLIAGPSIAFLFPIWLLGALLYDTYAWLHPRRYGLASAAAAAAVFFSFIALLRHPIVSLLQHSHTAARAQALSTVLRRITAGRLLAASTNLPWLDRLSISFYITGTCAAVALLCALLFFDRIVPPISSRIQKVIRFVADSTFVLYLVHVPLSILFTTLHGKEFTSPHAVALLLLTLVAISALLAIACDRLKNKMRSALRRRFIRAQASS